MSLTKEELQNKNTAVFAGDGDILDRTVEAISMLLDECEITLNEKNRFFVTVNCEYIMLGSISERMRRIKPETSSAERARAATGTYDFGHTSPDWESVISLGICGLRARVVSYLEKNAGNAEKARYLSAVVSVYDRAIAFMHRAASVAEQHGKSKLAEGLRHLTVSPPANLFEAMQTTMIYYTLQQRTENAIPRTLVRLDSLYFDFYNKECDEGYVRALVRDFLLEIDSWRVGSNIPFAIGADAHRDRAENPLTRIFIEEYRALELPHTKLHILCRDDIGDATLAEAFGAIRDGKNSILFMSDKTVTDSLLRLREDACDARDYHVVGCYECGGKGELICSCNARVNIAKALEYALSGGVDVMTGERVGLENDGSFATFDELFDEYLRQLEHLLCLAASSTEHFERHYPDTFAAPFLSSTYISALENGGDVYRDFAAKYNNSSVNALGIATAVDSLAAIKRLVYDEGRLTLDDIRRILRNDWSGEEALRLTVKNRFPKYGMGIKEVDDLAARTVKHLADITDRRPNARGGRWRLGTFSIDWRHDFGAHTAASADGRKSGETLSQNTSATFGQDRDGATAHMLTACSIDNKLTPNGSVIDLDVHISAVEGDDGIRALIAGLRTYMDLGGFAVHYNILDTQTLRRAKENPEDYPNLQVRLCGWNVLFSALSDKEKDEFIARFAAQER